MRFQAVNSGFAAPHTRSRQPAESRSTVRKTAQESQESEGRQKARFFGSWDFKTGAFNRSATLPRAENRKASRFVAGSVVVAGVAAEDDHPAVGRGGGLLDQALVA
jgi:hypothetical protein